MAVLVVVAWWVLGILFGPSAHAWTIQRFSTSSFRPTRPDHKHDDSRPPPLSQDHLEGNQKIRNLSHDLARDAQRRACLLWGTPLLVGMMTMMTTSAQAASLLEEYGGRSSPAMATPSSTTDTNNRSNSNNNNDYTPNAKGEKAIDPTLRANYYYPTARKRYLPRIQKVAQALPEVSPAVRAGDWETVSAFCVTAEKAILPLQLYLSSLDGQGLRMANSYAKAMKQDALLYQQAYTRLQPAVQRRQVEPALRALADLEQALTDYRIQGRLTEDDGDKTSIPPSVDDIRRSTMRRPTVAVPTL